MTRRTVIDLGMATAAMVAFAGVVMLTTRRAHAESVTLDQAKEILRLRYSELCSAPMPPGDALPQALNQAIVADPATWGPWVAWWNEIHTKYRKAGCGNA